MPRAYPEAQAQSGSVLWVTWDPSVVTIGAGYTEGLWHKENMGIVTGKNLTYCVNVPLTCGKTRYGLD